MSRPDVARALSMICVSGMLLCAQSCGGPSVVYSTMPGDIRTVRNWRLEVENHLTGLSSPGSETEEGKKQVRALSAEFADKYADSVKAELVRRGLMGFYDNQPTDGTMVLRLEGIVRLQPSDRESQYFVRDNDPATWNERTSSVLGEPDQTSDSLVRLSVDLRDRVTGASVTLKGGDGKVMGSLQLRWSQAAKHVGTSDVVKAISKAIEESRRRVKSY